MKAIILAGGKGTRFLPLTETIPKALIPVGHTTLLEIVLDTLPDSIHEIIITTKYLGQKIQSHIGNKYRGKIVHYAEQPEDQEGTWPAFYCTKDFIEQGEKFCVLNCDDLFKSEELATVIASEKIGMGVTRTVMPAKYHGILISDVYTVEGFKRHTDVSHEELVTDLFANGFFLLDSCVFSFEPVTLIDGEFGLPQTLLRQKETYPLYVHEFAFWQPCNTPEDLLKLG